jgi:two-component system sensor kinase FixL
MKVGLVPAVALATVMWLVIILNLFPAFTLNPPYLQFILNMLFITGTGFAVAFISGKSYLNDGSPTLLLLGCAVLISALTAFFAGWASSSANANTTIFNIGILVSSFFQLSAAYVMRYNKEIERFFNRKITLGILYIACLVFVIILTVSSVLNLIPPFFIADGPTLLSELVLGISVGLLVVATMAFVWQYIQTKSSVIYWYSLAMVIITAGLFGQLFADQFSGVLIWLARIMQYTGGFYFLIALLALRNPRGTDLTIAGKWNEAFMINQKQIANLFSKMLNGFTYCRIITDNDGNPIDWVYLDVNDSFAKTAGRAREDFLGKKASELTPNLSQNCSNWISRFGKVAQSGEATIFEDYSKPFKKWFSISAYSPKKGYFVTLSEDITERKMAEEALKTNEQRWATTLSSIGDAVIATDIAGNVSLINAVAEKITGFQESEALGKPIHAIFTIVDAENQRVIDNPVKNHDNYGLDRNLFLITKDNAKVPIEYNLAPIKIEQNQTVGFVLVFRDVTERKKMEDAMSYSEMKYRRLFETTQDGIIARNLQGRMIDCNQAYAKMLGYSKKELKDHSYIQVLPEKWRDHRETVIKNVLETGHPMFYEREYMRKDGSLFPASVRTWRLTSDKGEVLGVWSTVHDISEHKETQKKLEEYSKMLEQLVEERTQKLKDAERLAAIGETAGMVGHDIRNPLQSIISEVYLSKGEIESLSEGEHKVYLKDSLNSIENQAMYINKIVADLQDYTKLASPQFEEVDLQHLMQDVLATIPIPGNIKTVIQIDAKKDPLKIRSDPYFLKRILTNLSLNAIQAMPNGGELTLYAGLKRNKAIISVNDTGAGIPDDVKKKLFKPLVTTKPKGQGFGLAVAKKLTEALNGTITFESQTGKGTTFAIFLPQKTVQKV